MLPQIRLYLYSLWHFLITHPQGHLLVIGLLGSFQFFYGLGSYGLMHNNEGLYAQIPLEMLARGNFVIPYLNGVPYIEKPPLLYWLIAGLYKLGGVSVTTARVIPALSGLITCYALYAWGYKQRLPLVGLLTALMLMTSGAFIVFTRMVYFDGLLTCCLSLALMCFYQGSLSGCRKYLTASYIFLALAILTKGFVALILYGAVVGLWVLLNRSWALIKWILSPLPLIIFISILLPWHFMAHIQDPDFSYFYFMNEHILRFLGRREPKDYYHGPLYYYIPRLLLYGLPWTFLSFQAFRFLQRSPLILFLGLWVGVFFIFFSLSQAKANYYIMTLLPPLFFLMALGLVKAFEKPSVWTQSIPLLFASLLLGGAMYGCFIANHPVPLPALITAWFLGVGIFIKKPQGFIIPLTFAVQVSLLITTALQVIPLYEPLVSAHAFAGPFDKACLYKDYEKMSSVVFYAGKPLPLYESQSNDLAYGLKKNPDKLVTESELPDRCQGFFVCKDKWVSFEKEFPFYKVHQEVGSVRYYIRGK